MTNRTMCEMWFELIWFYLVFIQISCHADFTTKIALFHDKMIKLSIKNDEIIFYKFHQDL